MFEISNRSTPENLPKCQSGFSLAELLVATAVLLGVSSIVMTGMIRMSLTQGTIHNRSAMHGSVRNATELLQQEMAQAGKIALPANVTLTGAVPAAPTGGTVTATVGVSNAAGMFNGLHLVIDTGDRQETVTLTAVDLAANQITATFRDDVGHASGAPVSVAGTFSSGVVPSTVTNGSTGTVLKLFGDINDDGNMVYVEYTCDLNVGNLYRNVMPITASTKPTLTSANILLPSILPNPDGTPCFTYEEKTVLAQTYVLNVAVSLTVQTELRDPQTGEFQTETKGLLNVSPRNVFQGWKMASAGIKDRIQPIPPTVMALLPSAVTDPSPYPLPYPLP